MIREYLFIYNIIYNCAL